MKDNIKQKKKYIYTNKHQGTRPKPKLKNKKLPKIIQSETWGVETCYERSLKKCREANYYTKQTPSY